MAVRRVCSLPRTQKYRSGEFLMTFIHLLWENNGAANDRRAKITAPPYGETL